MSAPRRVCAALLSLIAVMTAQTAAAQGRVRLVEAVAVGEVDRGAVLKIIPVNEDRGRERAYPDLQSRLAEALKNAGFNVRQDAAEPDIYVKFDYGARSFSFNHLYGSTTDSAYRMIIITAVAGEPWRGSQKAKVLWRTVVDQTGLSSDVGKVIPPLIKAATPWYGRTLTKAGIASILAVCRQGSADAGHIAGACTRSVMPLQ